jgi:hypothetical protein
MKIGFRAAAASLGLAAMMASAPPAGAAEQVYELTINNWARADASGEMDITWRARLNPAGTRTSTASVGTVCMDGGSWAFKDDSQPRQIKYLKSPSDRASGVARVKAVGTWTGSRDVRFWAVMGTGCGRPNTAESNVVTRSLAR